MNWYLAALKKYADFGGRARRKEYWFFFLFYLVFYLLATVFDMVLGTYSMELEIGVLSGCFIVAMLIPALAVAVRRLHDTDRRGWWLLLMLIPIAGGIWLLVLLVLDGQAGANRFGVDPKANEG